MGTADTSAIRDAIRERGLATGFDAVGFAAPALDDRTRDRLGAFLAAGYHADMAWMADKTDRRGDPRTLWPEAGTVIALGLSYAPDGDPLAGLADPERGVISAYARNRDYHDLIKGRLKTVGQWIHHRYKADVKVFVDTAPVLEKPLAAQAGLGWQGKHTVLVSRRHGSWLFLGEIYTTLVLPPDDPGTDRCGRCTRCQDICPTGAFPRPCVLVSRRCSAYLTIEPPGPIPGACRPAIGDRDSGCDDCIAVCPWNRFAQASREAAFLPRAELTAPRLAVLAELDDAGFRRLFSASPIKRIGRERFVRNVMIAIGNSGTPALLPVAMARLGDDSPLVRETAAWAVARLQRRDG